MLWSCPRAFAIRTTIGGPFPRRCTSRRSTNTCASGLASRCGRRPPHRSCRIGHGHRYRERHGYAKPADRLASALQRCPATPSRPLAPVASPNELGQPYAFRRSKEPISVAKPPNSPRALLRSACPIRVWNGIFAARDWRAKRGLKTMSPRRDRKSETTTREKWPEKRPFC